MPAPDRNSYADEIQSIIGKKIERVSYVLANKFEYDLGSIHSVDFGIVIKFEHETYLAWQIEEDEVDFENDLFIPQRYVLKFFDILEDIDKYFKVEDVSKNQYWKRLLGKPISDIKVYAKDFRARKIVSDLILETTSERVAIMAIEEPIESLDEIDIDFSVGNEWTVVVFDEETIASSERY
jgi:hypothetical protein